MVPARRSQSPPGATDMRRIFHVAAAQVQTALEQQPYSGVLPDLKIMEQPHWGG
jgi:hypothetical protein